MIVQATKELSTESGHSNPASKWNGASTMTSLQQVVLSDMPGTLSEQCRQKTNAMQQPHNMMHPLAQTYVKKLWCCVMFEDTGKL